MLTLADILDQIFDGPNLMFAIMGFIAVVAIVFGSVTKIATSRARERTKREIAAYVAEGSIDPDKAVAMLNAGGAESDKKA